MFEEIVGIGMLCALMGVGIVTFLVVLFVYFYFTEGL